MQTLTSLLIVFGWVLWGAGLSLLLFPVRLKPLIWVSMAPLGIAAQTAFAWWRSHAGIPLGSARGATFALPLIALIASLLIAANRRFLRRSLRSREPYLVLLILLLGVLRSLGPLDYSSKGGAGPTTVSIGSCDAPDYAMGGKMLLQGSQTAVNGFWGQTDVHQLPPGMTLFGFWYRLNHYGPAALLAFTATFTGLDLWRLITPLAGALGALTLLAVWSAARHLFRLRSTPSFWIVMIAGLSPFWVYGVYHAALGQLLGTIALTWAVVISLRLAALPRRISLWQFCFLAGAAFWLLLGSYAFATCFVLPLYGVLPLFCPRPRRALGLFAGWVVAGFAANALLFWGRVEGFVEALLMFGRGVAGWHLGALGPGSLLGVVGDAGLAPPRSWMPSLVATALLILAFWSLARGQRRLLAAALYPFLVTGGLLAYYHWSDPTDAGLSSYKSYKLFSLFLPLLVAGLLAYPARLKQRLVGGASLAALVALIVIVYGKPLRDLSAQASTTSLTVSPSLQALQALPAKPPIDSVNIVLKSTWDRLWASYFFSEVPQYFSEPTYTTRGPTALKGTWTLVDRPPSNTDFPPHALEVGTQFLLVPAPAP